MVNRVKPSCEILDDASRATYFIFDNGPLFVDSGSNSLPNTQQSISLASSGQSSQAVNSNNSSSFVQISGLTGLGVINQSFLFLFGFVSMYWKALLFLFPELH